MRGYSSAIDQIRPDQVWRWSKILLAGLFAFGIAVILIAAWTSTTALLVIGALLLGALVFGMLIRNEIALLSSILAGFVVVARYREGFQVEEVIYGLTYLGYLAYWFVSRQFFYRDRILRTKIDWSLFLFLAYATLSLGLTPLFGGDVQIALSEWQALSMLAFYFPIKELCIRNSGTVAERAVLLSLGFVALFIVLRNVNMYVFRLSQAEYLWQVATGRVVMNEHVLLVAGIVTLALLLYATRWYGRSLLSVLFLLFSAGIVIGQSRAVWVSFALGVAVIFFFVDRQRRLQIAALGLLGIAIAFGIGSMMFDNFFRLIVAGLTTRFFSLQTAVTHDVSLINRFLETAAAWEYVKQNPILGYGFGVPMKYYSLVYKWTHETSFIHNGYVGVLYKHGAVGFGLLFYYYFGSMWSAFRTARHADVGRLHRTLAIAALGCLSAIAIVANTENPFATSDKTLFIAAVTALTASSGHITEQKRIDARDG